MEVPKYIIEFINNNGYETAEYLGKYRGRDAYSAIYRDDGQIYHLGYPVVILDKNGDLEWVQDNRSLKILDLFYDDDDIDDDPSNWCDVIEMTDVISEAVVPEEYYLEYLALCKFAGECPIPNGGGYPQDLDIIKHQDNLRKAISKIRKTQTKEEFMKNYQI